eukprot:TRINITY_DN20536_c0_g1_i1.p1 TRINITY_DN20536_c0_g1~~TRINITY_DN20536_c0_g1_i1.p1  ORF type:complete len:478 (+),score=95.30 TRINITY_DN20536_c0_g1_i1:58-1491(+)
MAKRTRAVPGMVFSEDDDDLDTETLSKGAALRVTDSDNYDSHMASKMSKETSPKGATLQVPDSDNCDSHMASKMSKEERLFSRYSDGSRQVMQKINEEVEKNRERQEELVQQHEDAKEGVRYQARKIGGFDPDELGPFRKFLHDIIDRKAFDAFIGFVIALNGVTIGVETTHKVALKPLVCDEDCNCTLDDVVCTLTPGWVAVCEWIFFFIYLLELVARIFVFRLQALKNHWIQFDSLLVFTAILDVIMKLADIQDATLKKFMLFRLFRLARLARAVRLMSQFQTLWQLVAGLMFSLKTLLWTFVLLSIMIYMFALFGMEFITVDLDLPLTHPYNQAALDNFRGLENAGLFLIQCFSWDSIGGVYRPLIQHRRGNFFYFMVVLLVNSIALANIVVAILVQGALEQGNEDKDAQKAWEAAKKQKQMEQLKLMFKELDEDGSGELSMDEIDGAPEELREQLIEIAGTEDLSTQKSFAKA